MTPGSRDYITDILACIAAVLCALLLLACINHERDRGGWDPSFDLDWKMVTFCWQHDPAKPSVVVRKDCRSKYSSQDFNIGILGRENWVHGTRSGSVIEVCPDLKALRHEFSHYVSEKKRGTPGYNGEGKCWL